MEKNCSNCFYGQDGLDNYTQDYCNNMEWEGDDCSGWKPSPEIKIDILKKAIEFYSDSELYKRPMIGLNGGEIDTGKVARQALKDIKEE